MTISKGYHNVFEALEDDPAMAQNLKIRSELMNCVAPIHRGRRA